jgi:hypothetical protein
VSTQRNAVTWLQVSEVFGESFGRAASVAAAVQTAGPSVFTDSNCASVKGLK